MLKKFTLLDLLALTACGQAEPRSVKYFGANLDEAKKVADDCGHGDASGKECANAELAVKLDEDRRRFERFRGKK